MPGLRYGLPLIDSYNSYMETEFKAAYSRLNQAQRAAVDAIEGPVLVVAGPGTGKTQLLSLRVANILRQTDTDASSILCLTFTNFAATNMRDRLSALVGPAAHSVIVKTFHSFAADIMNLYPDYFWNGARLQIAPDAVQLEIIQEILSALPLDKPLALKFAGAYTQLADIQQALRLAKEAGLTPEKLSAMLAVNQAYLDIIEPRLVKILTPVLSIKKLSQLQTAVEALPDQPIDASVTPLSSLSTVLKESLALAVATDQASGKTTETGKWKRRWLQTVAGQKGMHDERRRNQWWQSLAEVYALYRDRLHKNGYYDYSDMIVEVISQLERNPELLASVQERFLYVLIDEFQDTNAAQLRLAHLVASHNTTEGRPNLMAVGDDDQSIFAFNGAELSNMLTFQRTYPDTKVIVLSHNYRSSQAILDTAQTIIDQAEDRLVKREPALSKQLKAQADLSKGTIQHLSYPTSEHQMTSIAEHIQSARQTNPDESIAVLARGHGSLRSLSGLLTKLQVPIRYEQQNNILEQPLIQQIFLVAETVTAISQGNEALINHDLPQILKHPAWQIKSQTLWQLAVSNYREPHWLRSLEQHADSKLKSLTGWLRWLAIESASQPLPVMLEYILGLRAGQGLSSPLREHFLAKQAITNQYLSGLSALNLLREATDEFIRARGGQASLGDFVRFIRLHYDLDRAITDESWFVSGDQAVQLMTVHKAKGLEFDAVYVIDAVEDNWRPHHIGRKPPANLPLQPYGEQYDDYVRLLYVAATRARHSLIISSYATDTQGKKLLATPLIRALPMTEMVAADSPQNIEVLENALAWPRLEADDERQLLKQRLLDYQLSPTAFLQFLDVTAGGPEQFLEKQLLHLPEPMTAMMAYGTATHRALQTAQLLTNDKAFNMTDVLEAYDNSLKQQPITYTEINRYQTHGHQTLKSLFKDKGFKLIPGAMPEMTISDVRLEKAMLTGTFDHLQQTGSELIISDYKTGKPLTSFTTRDRTKTVKAWRHRNQLLFYSLLALRSGRFKSTPNLAAQLIYVEAETPDQLYLGLTPQPEELARLQKLIEIVWSHIMDLNFPDVRHYSQDIDGIRLLEADLLGGKI